MYGFISFKNLKSLIRQTMYAPNVKFKNDYLDKLEHAFEGAVETMIPGIYILDWFPIRKCHICSSRKRESGTYNTSLIGSLVYPSNKS